MRRWLGPAVLLLLTSVTGHAACNSVSVTAMTFGTYSSASALSFTATVTANCSYGYGYVVGLGQGISGIDNARTMTAGAINLNYGMYQNASHTVNWGANNGVNTENATGTGANQTFTIYGQVPAGQYVAPGAYTDSPIAYIQNSGLYVGLNVSATVAPSCSISATSLVFGVYNKIANLDSTGTLSVTCTNTTPYYVNLGNGLQPDGSWWPRMLGPNSALLSYVMYQDSPRTVVWRNSYNVDGESWTGTGTVKLLTVYGRIASGQNVVPGSYTDSVVATVTY